MIPTARIRRGGVALAVAAATAVALAACGSGSTGGASPDSTSPSTSAGMQKAAQLAAGFKKDPTSIGPTQKVGKPIPTGKSIVLIGAGPGGSGTVQTYAAFKQAAAILDWNVTELEPQSPTPQYLQPLLEQALRLHPAAVVISAVSEDGITPQLLALKNAGIPVVSTTGPDPSGGPILLQLAGADYLGNELGKATADQTIADMGGKPTTVGTVGIDGYAIIDDMVSAYTSEIKSKCPACQIENTNVSLASLGTSDGTDIVNFVRQHSGMGALLVGWDGMDTNLFPAAHAAGVNLPKTYSIAVVPQDLPYVRSGQLAGTTAFDTTDLGWRLADALARIFTGQTASALSQDTKYATPVIWSEANGNVPSSIPSDGSYPPVVSDYQNQWKALWGK